MGKKKALPPGEILTHLINELEQEFERWHHLYNNGGQDPIWSDGVNLNLVRNHILYFKKEIQDLCEGTGLPLPGIYTRPEPPKVSTDYMARADEIRIYACESLTRYKSDPEYWFLLGASELVDTKIKERISLTAVMGYVSGLQSAIVRDDLLIMRRHERSDQYIDSFRICAEKLRAALADTAAAAQHENAQLSLFN